MPPSTAPTGYVAPMLPTLVDEAPDGAEWHHEIKYDGYRTILSLDRESHDHSLARTARPENLRFASVR